MEGNINYTHLRSRGERTSLFLSFVLVLLITLYLFQINVWLVLGALIFQLVYIVFSQRQLMGNSLLVSSKQFPDIYEILIDNSNELSIKPPSVFVNQDPYLNAYTIGFFKPYSIVLSSALIEVLDKDELDFVIGHEMGHIKFGHAKYLSLISPIGQDVPFVSWLYAGWQRKSEYSADRVGYMLIKKIKPAITAMIKITVGAKLARLVDIDELIKQLQESERGLINKSSEIILTHPYTTKRIRSLVQYSHYKER